MFRIFYVTLLIPYFGKFINYNVWCILGTNFVYFTVVTYDLSMSKHGINANGFQICNIPQDTQLNYVKVNLFTCSMKYKLIQDNIYDDLLHKWNCNIFFSTGTRVSVQAQVKAGTWNADFLCRHSLILTCKIGLHNLLFLPPFGFVWDKT